MDVAEDVLVMERSTVTIKTCEASEMMQGSWPLVILDLQEVQHTLADDSTGMFRCVSPGKGVMVYNYLLGAGRGRCL
jgi:hypothetical protein